MPKLTADQMFFFKHAGYSYDPRTETKEQGRIRCAMNLAACEGIARNAGVSFEWAEDPDADSREFAPKKSRYALWCCVARDCNGLPVASLGAIDFGPDGTPWGDNYRRVVEAELACEHVNAELQTAVQ